MAQGTVKKPAARRAPTKQAHSKKQASRISKTGTKSKSKGGSSGSDKAHRKFTAGMAAKTEALLGERAGHLELIGKGKKAEKKEGKKGGSKKFG